MKYLTVAAVALAALAPSAHAGTLDATGGTLVYSDPSGEKNDLGVNTSRGAPGDLLIGETTLAITISQAAAAAGCRHHVDEDGQAQGNLVLCPIPQGVRVELGAGDDEGTLGGGGTLTMGGGPGADVLRAGSGPIHLTGDKGDDELRGAAAADRLIGGPGRDTLVNSEGDDRLDGGEGDDRLVNENFVPDGADALVGGPGNDELSYRGRSGSVAVSFDGQANDGRPRAEFRGEVQPGENDNVASDIEIAEGGAGEDRLIGDARANTLRGGAAFDRVEGGAGDDVLDGGSGGDIVRGDAGDDTLFGNDGRDAVVAGAGADTVRSDQCDGGPCTAGDQIHTRDDSRDTVRCGRGTDKVIADRRDETAGCASVEREAPVPDAKRPELRLVRTPAGATPAGIARRGLFLDMRCPTGCTVRVSLTISRKLARSLGLKSRTVGSFKKTLRAGKGTVAVRVRKGAARRKLRGLEGGSMRLRGRAVSGDEVLRLDMKLPPSF